MVERIISYNVRGLNDGKKKKQTIKEALQSWKSDIFCLQKKKMESIGVDSVKSLWRFRDVGWRVFPLVGASGGIIVLWNDAHKTCEDYLIGRCKISCFLRDCRSGIRWYFMGVYNRGEGSDRKMHWPGPWVVGD